MSSSTDQLKYLHHFRWDSSVPQSVSVKGSFDNWESSLELVKQPSGKFSAPIELEFGSKVAYKYVIDGVWRHNPNEPTESDPNGNLNNIFQVPQAPSLISQPTSQSVQTLPNQDQTSSSDALTQEPLMIGDFPRKPDSDSSALATTPTPEMSVLFPSTSPDTVPEMTGHSKSGSSTQRTTSLFTFSTRFGRPSFRSKSLASPSAPGTPSEKASPAGASISTVVSAMAGAAATAIPAAILAVTGKDVINSTDPLPTERAPSDAQRTVKPQPAAELNNAEEPSPAINPPPTQPVIKVQPAVDDKKPEQPLPAANLLPAQPVIAPQPVVDDKPSGESAIKPQLFVDNKKSEESAIKPQQLAVDNKKSEESAIKPQQLAVDNKKSEAPVVKPQLAVDNKKSEESVVQSQLAVDNKKSEESVVQSELAVDNKKSEEPTVKPQLAVDNKKSEKPSVTANPLPKEKQPIQDDAQHIVDATSNSTPIPAQSHSLEVTPVNNPTNNMPPKDTKPAIAPNTHLNLPSSSSGPVLTEQADFSAKKETAQPANLDTVKSSAPLDKPSAAPLNELSVSPQESIQAPSSTTAPIAPIAQQRKPPALPSRPNPERPKPPKLVDAPNVATQTVVSFPNEGPRASTDMTRPSGLASSSSPDPSSGSPKPENETAPSKFRHSLSLLKSKKESATQKKEELARKTSGWRYSVGSIRARRASGDHGPRTPSDNHTLAVSTDGTEEGASLSPGRKRGPGILNKIKSALSPHRKSNAFSSANGGGLKRNSLSRTTTIHD